jgi:ornithine--oxo-acid transaminase
LARSILDLVRERAGQHFDLHEKHLNTQMVRVLRTIGFDRTYVRASGPYLYDAEGREYLDLLSGYGVFALGHNHPSVLGALREVVESELPGLIQMDVSLLAGLLAERLLATLPSALDKVFFANSGTETVEAAIKFARYATRRPGIVYCDHAFHGLSLGALSLNGDEIFREGFGPLLPDTHRVPFDDLEALERVLREQDVAAFIVEPIQGHGVNVPSDAYLPEAARLCRRHGALFVADEVQSGMGRTGRMWAIEHWGVEPDMLLSAKALSGGCVPVGAVAVRKWIFDKVFSNMVRAPVHGSSFAKNNLAMAAGIATLDVLREENLVENAAKMGESILEHLRRMVGRYAFVKEVRGKGLMQAVEFAPPAGLRQRAAWKLLDAAQKGLFAQLVVVPLFQRHRVLCQTSGHDAPVVKFLPPLVIGEAERRWMLEAVEDVIADTENVGSAIWDLGKTLARAAIATKSRRG